MTLQSPRRLKSRFRRDSIPLTTLDGLLSALQTLMQVGLDEDPLFAERSLDLLVKHLKADMAYIVTKEGTVPETRWWYPEQPQEPPPSPVDAFCAWLAQNPHRTLVLRDVAESHFRDNQHLASIGVRAAAGATVWSNSKVRGFVFLHFNQPSQLNRIELAILDTVSGFLGRLLEVENMKLSLRRLENALEITKAVVEDSTIYDPVTHLPNEKYLDVWLSANLAMASEDHHEMTVAELCVPMETASDIRRIQNLGRRVRGGDLLVTEGNGRLLLILQRMSKLQGHQFLQRLLEETSELPIGATVWTPGKDDVRLRSGRTRLVAALSDSLANKPHKLIWD